MQYRTVDITWQGPFKVVFNAESANEGHSIPDLPADLRNRHGIYAIYGQHPVYGANTLLYIGQTEERTAGGGFRVRLGEHTNPQPNGKTPRFWYCSEMTVYLGLATPEGAEEPLTRDLIDIESLLIATHKPAMNQRHINVPVPESRDLLVFNWDNLGRLVPLCAGRWFFPD